MEMTVAKAPFNPPWNSLCSIRRFPRASYPEGDAHGECGSSARVIFGIRAIAKRLPQVNYPASEVPEDAPGWIWCRGIAET